MSSFRKRFDEHSIKGMVRKSYFTEVFEDMGFELDPIDLSEDGGFIAHCYSSKSDTTGENVRYSGLFDDLKAYVNSSSTYIVPKGRKGQDRVGRRTARKPPIPRKSLRSTEKREDSNR